MLEKPTADEGPRPFAHLGTEKRLQYRAVLRAFSRAKDRFSVHLRPEDVAADLGWQNTPELTEILKQLVGWGNLRADPDTGRVNSAADFHQRRYLYRLTAEGQAAEQAIEHYERVIGHRGALQSVALSDIADQLKALSALAASDTPDPAKTHLLLLSLTERFTSLADNAQAFMSSLRRAIDFSDDDVDAFIAYKDHLIGYIERFIQDLARTGAHIARLLVELKARDHERLLVLAARREASETVPDGEDMADVLRNAEVAALEDWQNRWRGLCDWFVPADSGRSPQARLLRRAALTAITQLIDTVTLLNERRHGRSDRSADFLTLAGWFADAPDEEAMHRLWRTAFGLASARHLTVTTETLAAWEERADPGIPWAQAPPVVISPQLRKSGSYERRGKGHRVQDRSQQKRLLAERAEREAAETAAARRRLCTEGPVLLSELDVLDRRSFRLFLALLGDALAARRPGDTEVKTTSADGSLEIRLSLVPGGGTVHVKTEDGVLSGPEHLVEITDGRGGR
ncbi:TIGR02677 family protein [Thermomonospora umbrina]|uniref:Uncharacterized protein (TIGR02677 family) n=1 Tax=Thermomonospora umbrina TaxID=111806 RepID=A0A3D9SJA1_9ACTN|nr:TIGR02677 family protein [Thermomonospora umbrina]REE95969.1 uncharacterized protein (TIGR02677 family) [Thermomonospora umbrina]